MRLYIQESDRQVRVYGLTPQTPENTPALEQQGADGANGVAGGQQQQPRGLAAIPLLCAAASESRQAYLRRLANTRPAQAWWMRQEVRLNCCFGINSTGVFTASHCFFAEFLSRVTSL